MSFHHHLLGWDHQVCLLATEVGSTSLTTLTDPLTPEIRHSHLFYPREVWLLEGAYFKHRSGVVYLRGNAVRDSARSATKKISRIWLPSVFSVRASAEPVIVTGQSPKNYYHWLIEDLPAVLRAKTVQPQAGIVVGGNQPTYVTASLAAAGLGQIATTLRDLRRARIVLGGQNRDSGWPHPGDVSVLRETFAPLAALGGKNPTRIFVSRGNGRRSYLNESEVEASLQDIGLTVVRLEAMTFLEQVQLFASAEIVVGAHGAGLSNTVFCQPGTRVLELAPRNRAIQCFEIISQHCDLVYSRFLTPGARAPRKEILDSSAIESVCNWVENKE